MFKPTVILLVLAGIVRVYLIRLCMLWNIVVGGGTAGLTVARRLSEDDAKKVLVLEAGQSGVNDSLVTIPENSFKFVGTDIDWFYNTAPQTHAANQTVNLSSGKILGGDSAVNGLVWVRGAKEDYNAIESLGNPGWNWDRFYAAMRKAETLEQPSQQLVDEYGFVINSDTVGSTGPVHVSFPAFLPIAHQKFIPASIELGHDFNGNAYEGDNTDLPSVLQLNLHTVSAPNHMVVPVNATCLTYIAADPVASRRNLIILYNGALVTSLNFTGSGTVTASGVNVLFPDGTMQHAKVLQTNGEVILSAGTIRTPQLLELSGIGDKNILTPLGIPVKVDLPGVGTNYEDQTLTILTYLLKEPYESFDALAYIPGLETQQEELYKQGKGWLTFANSILDMVPVDKILSPEELVTANRILESKPPNIQQEVFEAVRNEVFTVPQAEYLLFNSFSAGPVKEANRSYVSMAITHLHPLSRGTIHINSTSIDDHPVINPNLLESEWDLWFLAKATAYARNFFQTPAFLEIFEEEVFPTVANVSTDAQWEEVRPKFSRHELT
ncbi:hypothetical protein H0H92_001318 [Tricholoma furcatifolium]|nr:hypothetical protein H0H92_001318 [Tricholoma furcatifolium]